MIVEVLCPIVIRSIQGENSDITYEVLVRQLANFIVSVFLVNLIILVLTYIIIAMNKPTVSRKDLVTGQNVSMLLFVRSKIQMRKIFDPESY